MGLTPGHIWVAAVVNNWQSYTPRSSLPLLLCELPVHTLPRTQSFVLLALLWTPWFSLATVPWVPGAQDVIRSEEGPEAVTVLHHPQYRRGTAVRKSN